jgi:nucleotide-binding universal stress UspA family protein
MFGSGPILVPLDGSAISERSLPYATAIARALERRLVLMIAAYISDIPEHGPWSDDMVSRPREICTAYLEGVLGRIGRPDAQLVVKVGYPHEMISETVAEQDSSLIVLSSHGRSGLSRWMYGSTAGHVIHSSPRPVLVIGKGVRDIAPGGFAPKHVLVPLDGSSLGEAALAPAGDLAAAFGAKTTLIRVAPFSAEAFPMSEPMMYWPKLDDELVASATAYLEKTRSSVKQPVEIKVLQGARADVLLGFVETEAIDLVVMTTHGRAGLQRALLGSTADRMLGGRAPVLLIRPEPASN